MIRQTIAFIATLMIGVLGTYITSEAQSSDHGESLKLGSLTIAGQDFTITRLGELVPGKEGAFEVTTTETTDLGNLSLYLWLENKAGEQISAPSKGSAEGAGLHFHATPKLGSSPHRVTLRLRKNGMDERASLPLDGHGHEHSTSHGGPHDGVVAKLKDAQGVDVGYVELKLHDDKGDLELWLGKDNQFKEAFDLPLPSTVMVTFIDLPNKSATLKVRNQEKNEDEEGNLNVRNGMTNYFIYPSTTGEDASWLKGAKFQSIVELSFSVGDKQYKSEEFMLVPHTHTDGHKH